MKKKIKFDNNELKMITESLGAMREKLQKANMYTDAVDDLLFRFLKLFYKIN